MNTKVRHYLIELARQKVNQTVTYQKLSDDCELRLDMRNNPNDRVKIGKILDDISTYEHENNKRPLLSALVVRAGDNYEGDGFYKLAERLGFGKWQSLKNEGIFEVVEIGKCIKFWSNDVNFSNYK